MSSGEAAVANASIGIKECMNYLNDHFTHNYVKPINTTNRAILQAAAEICNRKPTSQFNKGCWGEIAKWVGCQSNSKETTILSALLCFAIDEACTERNTYIGRIMGLDKNVQRTLMQLIKDFNDQKVEATPPKRSDSHPDESYLDDLNIDEDNESLLDEADVEIDDDASYLDDLRIDEDNESLMDEHNSYFDKENVNHCRESFPVPKSVGVPVQQRAPLSPKFSTTNANNVMSSSLSNLSKPSPQFSTPIKLVPPPQHPASCSRNASARKVIKLEKETVSLRERNNELMVEIEACRRQENVLRVRCEETEAINRAARLKLESEALMRDSEIRHEFERKVEALENELKRSRNEAKDSSVAKEQLASLRDEVDILKHTKVKLEQTENQMLKLKSKLEEMTDIGKALKSEEKAHSDAVSKCLALENQLSALVPLKRQLEEYKSRATNAEVRLVDCEDEIKKLREASENISGLNDELQRGTLRQQEEVDSWRRNMEQNESDVPLGLAIGEGISELNPALKEELLRLRNENTRLKEFAAKREDDSVQRLEEKADDANRLADKFKEQYRATKSTLESTQRDLTASLKRERQLESRVSDMEKVNKELKQNLSDERISSQKAKLDATRALHATKKDLSDQAKIEKEQLVKEWESRLEKAKVEFEETHNVLAVEAKKNEDSLNTIIKQLRDQSVESLKKIEKEFSEKMTAIEQSNQENIDNIKIKNEEERAKLIDHGKQLLQDRKDKSDAKIQALEKANQEVKEEHDKLVERQKEYEKKVNDKFLSYKQRITLSVSRMEDIARENDDLQTNAKKLEREKSNIQSENDRLRRQLGGRFGSDQGQYEELQRNYNDLLAENRMLKEKVTSNTPTSDLVNSFNFASTTRPYSAGASISASSLSQLRAEYEEKIEEINDEKRELIMKNSSLITEEKKAQKRAFEMEVKVKELENMTTSLQLQLERSNHQKDTILTPPPVTKGNRGLSTLTPSSVSSVTSKSSRIWKLKKSNSKKGSPDSTEPMVDLKSPEFQKSMKKMKDGDVEGFKKKLMRRLSSKKKKGSPLKSMSLMDMAANNKKKLEF